MCLDLTENSFVNLSYQVESSSQIDHLVNTFAGALRMTLDSIASFNCSCNKKAE